MREQFPPVTINFAPVKVAGAAGVPLLVVVGAIAIVLPVARWLFLLGGLGGVLLSVAMILVRRRRYDNPGGDSPTRLYPGAQASALVEPSPPRCADRQTLSKHLRHLGVARGSRSPENRCGLWTLGLT